MGVEPIAGRHLCFDVGNRQISTHPDVHSLRNLRKVNIALEGRDVVAVSAAFRQQLVAENALHYGVAIAETIHNCDIEASVYMILLRAVGQAFDPENTMIE